MKKIFKLALAEFNKIFYRPSIFILTALLIIVLVVSNFYFKPTTTVNKLSYVGANVEEIHKQFMASSTSGSAITKASIDKSIADTKKEIDEAYYNLVSIDKYQELTDQVLVITTYYEKQFISELLYIVQLSPAEFNSTRKTRTIAIFNELRTKCSDITNYLASSIKDTKLNFYMSQADYDFIYSKFLNLHDDLLADYSTYNLKDFISRAEILRDKYKAFLEGIDKQTPSEISQKLNSFEKIELDAKIFKEMIDTYYTEPVEKLEKIYFKNVEDVYAEIATSNEQEDIAKLNVPISQYYSYANMNMTVLKNKFTLYHIGDKTDTQLKELVGFSEVSKYQLTEQIQTYQYLLDNGKFDYDYLTSFNFNISSGETPNVYDYTFFTMQILTLLISIFTIFYACSSIAGDQSTGTMKMIAIRPYSRNKLFAGKYISCFLFALLLLVVSFVASFVVGAVSYGITFAPCLIVFNSTVVAEISPLIILLIYFLSLAFNVMFFISLAMFLSLICKSNTLSVFLTSIILIVGLVLNGLVGAVWLKYFPLAHLDLFKYLGNSQLGLFSNNILPDTNFVLSFGIVFGLIVFMNIFSHIIFKHRDIA